MSRKRTLLSSIGALVLSGTLTPAASAQQLAVELVADGFSAPLYAVSPPGDTTRIFVLEQNSARIKIIKNGVVLGTPFLDLGAISSSGGERGLLGLAFHPDYTNNGRFFVNFTNNAGNTRVWEYARDAGNPDLADPAMVQSIQAIGQPFSNHNGGWIAFGPDGMLYIGMGDGGSANDPGNRAQDLTTRLGKMLRLDIDIPSPFVPGDNPFVGAGGGEREEIWAYGIRNPWRCSFDRATGDLYMGDVGQNAWEEIDFQPAASTGGENYGWRCMEGNDCTGFSGCTCDDAALTDPIHEYNHSAGNGSITGGYMYRGPITDLQGTYFFADFSSSRIWSFRYDGATVTDFTNRTNELEPAGGKTIDNVSSFGEDAEGNLYIVDYDGEIWKIVEECDITTFCDTNPDNVANIGIDGCECATGSLVVAMSGAPANQFGYLLIGAGTMTVTDPAGAQGDLCLGGATIGRYTLDAGVTDGNGFLSTDILNAVTGGGGGNIPTIGGNVCNPVGQSWRFQFWHRDGMNPSKFSKGLSVTFE